MVLLIFLKYLIFSRYDFSDEEDNIIAKKLYEGFGFRDNGEIYNNEPIKVLEL